MNNFLTGVKKDSKEKKMRAKVRKEKEQFTKIRITRLSWRNIELNIGF